MIVIESFRIIPPQKQLVVVKYCIVFEHVFPSLSLFGVSNNPDRFMGSVRGGGRMCCSRYSIAFLLDGSSISRYGVIDGV